MSYNLKIVKKDNDNDWIYLTTDNHNFRIGDTWNIKLGGKEPIVNLGYYIQVHINSFDLMYHKDYDVNNYIISSIDKIDGHYTNGAPNNWYGLFYKNIKGGEKICKEIVKKKLIKRAYGKERSLNDLNTHWYIIPKEDFLLDVEAIEIDDDPSYTEGYRSGYTGLKWL